MNSDEKKCIEKFLFENLCEVPQREDRIFLLEWACRGDVELKVRLERLLELDDDSEKFFDFIPFETCDTESEATAGEDGEIHGDDEIGLRIGKYRLIRRLGEGGCGVVYLAEQETPLRRHVALKLIRVGLDHVEVCRRFEEERQSLAMMDHPGIARVLDAGATTTGRPYFVMQWVSGERITEFCDRHQLTIQQRLELFVKVCHAIQHAHQKGLIHRDIKPSNILVADHDGTALPKVIDFGIAKATGRVEADSESVSHYVLGTPDYMSPEQALQNGAGVDTRSDIFSLGVLLGELIAGSPPFSSGGPEERMSVAPSQRYAAADERTRWELAQARHLVPRTMAKALVGDLDAIVLKCVQVEPIDRYNTAHGLATDVMHYLQDEPVGAHPPSRVYRFSKLFSRNKMAFTAGAALFLVLAVGFGTSTVLFFREKNARHEQALLRSMAEQSRTAEARLREVAEARELCAQASVLIMYERMEDADKMAARIPESLIPSSLEAANLFGSLGNWHITHRRWPQASRCYSLLFESFSAVDSSDTDIVSRNLLPAVAAACQAEDWDRYERLRSIAIQRFGKTRHPVVAEQIVKVCLLRPADSVTMEAVAQLSQFVENSLTEQEGPKRSTNLRAWAEFSMALGAFRVGNHTQAIRWCRQSLDTEKQNAARVASVRLIYAMAKYQSNSKEQAHEELAEVRLEIQKVLNSSIEQWATGVQGTVWADWVNAHLLLKEAELLIDSGEK